MTATDSRPPADDHPAALGDSTFGHVIDGVRRDPDEDVLDVIAPATGRRIATASAGTTTDVDDAVAAARAALPRWRALPPADRARALARMADLTGRHAAELAAIESANVGKPPQLAAEEMAGVSETFRFMGGAARALQAPASDRYVAGHLSIVRREPHGVVGAITPWNYPLMTASWKIGAALAMGNTLVLKPSELTPLTTLRLAELAADLLGPGVLNVVNGSGTVVGSAIAAHPGIDMVSITGSVSSGRHVMRDASASLKPVHLELGGKAPVVVFADGDLDAVAATVRMAGFVNTGQECGAATRLLVHRSVASSLVDRLVTEAEQIVVGGPETEGVEMGPLISEGQRDRVAAMVDAARSDGATVHTGGRALPGDGFFYAPTVLSADRPGGAITTEEIFGPVVTVETFDDERAAVELANDTAYGLAASVWTADLGLALRATDLLDFGTVWVNDHLVLAHEMPWVGFGASGHGRECSTLSLEDFSRTKHVMLNERRPEGDPAATGTAE